MEANARTIYGPNRCLDVISFAPTSSRKIGAVIVEHNPMNRSYIHCASAKEDSRLAAVEHLLVITEDLMQRLIDAEGITSSGWLPATPQVCWHVDDLGRRMLTECDGRPSMQLHTVLPA